MLFRSTVQYNVADAAGHPAAEVMRSVKVEDTTPPVITRAGAAEIRLPFWRTYTDPGATANDACDGNLTESIAGDSNLVQHAPGTYTVTYNVSDTAENAAQEVTRTVIIEDAPDIYVDAALGSDSLGDGTSGAPFKTIGKAMTMWSSQAQPVDRTSVV